MHAQVCCAHSGPCPHKCLPIVGLHVGRSRNGRGPRCVAMLLCLNCEFVWPVPRVPLPLIAGSFCCLVVLVDIERCDLGVVFRWMTLGKVLEAFPLAGVGPRSPHSADLDCHTSGCLDKLGPMSVGPGKVRGLWFGRPCPCLRWSPFVAKLPRSIHECIVHRSMLGLWGPLRSVWHRL